MNREYVYIYYLIYSHKIYEEICILDMYWQGENLILYYKLFN